MGETQLPLLSPERQSCINCCNDGEVAVPCLDVEACGKGGGNSSRTYAIVLSQVGGWPADRPFLPFVTSMRRLTNMSTTDKIDILLLMTRQDAPLLNDAQR